MALMMLPFLMLACAPFIYEPKVEKINPTGPWFQGKQIHTDTLGDLVAMIQYEKATAYALIFIIGISNISKRTHLVDPLLFTSRGYGFDPGERDTAKYSITKPVFDPEKILIRLKNNIAEAKAEGSDVTGFLQILTLIRPPNETPAERTERIALYNHYTLKEGLDDLKNQNEVQQKKQHLASMENILLRKTHCYLADL